MSSATTAATTRQSTIAARLKELVNELSGYPVEELADMATFLDLGFDSLFLTQLATAFQGEFKVKITFRQLFEDLPSIGALSRHIDNELPEAPPVVAEVPASAPAPRAEPVLSVTAVPDPVREQQLPAATQHSRVRNEPMDAARVAVIESVMRQQMELMAQQLETLRSARPGPPTTVVAELGATAMPVEDRAAAAPAPRAAEASASPSAEAAAASGSAMPSGFGPGSTRRSESQVTASQRAHIDRLTERYTRKTATSKRMAQEYRRWHADPRTAAGFNHLWKEMVYPIVVNRSSGSRVWDVDGNEYIDVLNGFGPNFLGHSPPFVTEALKAQLDRGIEVGPQTPLAGETAQLFCEMTGMDRVSFVNTGSEAVQAALRLARTVTGRDKVVIFRKDYHGNFDEVLVRGVDAAGGKRLSIPLAPGIPRRAVQDVIVLDYGTDESLDVIRQLGDELAAVIVEPIQSRRPELQPREFLHALRGLTTDAGSLLVFDEVITGFRMCPGGAQQFFGVEADLATYGKVVGGGMPIGVVAGRARFMDTFDGGMWQYGDASFPEAGVTFFAGTFVRHPLAIAAANATLKYLKAVGPGLQEGVNRSTTRLTGALNSLFERNGIDIEVPHCCSQMFIRVNESSELATLLFYHLRDRGVHLLEGFPTYMTAAHTNADIDALIERFTDSVGEMQADGLLPGTAEGAAGTAWARGPQSFALTPAQQDVWLASQMGDEASCAFNESDTLELRGTMNLDALQRAVGTVLGRHQSFSLTFSSDGAEQRVSAAAPVIEIVDLSDVLPTERPDRVGSTLRTQALTPFSLEDGPLVRPIVIRLAEDHHLLVIYSHHIVFDGWSADVIMRDIAQAYSAYARGDEPQLEPAVAFSEYVASQSAFDASPDGAAALDFWRAALAGPPARLELPTDRPRAAVRSYAGSTVHQLLNPAVSEAVKKTARSLGLTTHTLLVSTFEVLLSRLSMQSDFVIGVPAAGQAAAGLESLSGYCVNLLPIRAACVEGTPFSAFARSVRGAVLDAFENQRADFSTITRELVTDRNSSRLPLIEVVFNYSGYLRKLEFAGLEVSAHENRRGAVLHDMFFNVVEDEGQFVIDCDYNTDLFDEETIRQWIQHFEVLLGAIAENPDSTVDALPLMSVQEQQQLVTAWNRGPGAR